MIEYRMIVLRPVEKSNITQKGRRSFFFVEDPSYGHLVCFNRYLYDGIQVGREINVRVAEDKRSVIVDVIGFKPIYPDTKQKPPINKAEAEFFNLMEAKGWELTKKGWPDFACFKRGKLILVEVKPKRSHRLKHWQRKLMLELVKHGVKCYRWSPDGGFEPTLEYIKFPIDLP